MNHKKEEEYLFIANSKFIENLYKSYKTNKPITKKWDETFNKINNPQQNYTQETASNSLYSQSLQLIQAYKDYSCPAKNKKSQHTKYQTHHFIK